MNMYKIKAILHIHANFSGCSSDDVWLEREFYLPFIPTTDITIKLPHICDKEYHDSEYCEKTVEIRPIEIYYVKSTDSCEVYVESDKELYNKMLDNRNVLGETDYKRLYEIVYFWRHLGWELR